jgi:phosphate transport system substrate-binding protein
MDLKLARYGVVALAGLLLAGCGGGGGGEKKEGAGTVLKGAGATLPQPAYEKWIKDYTSERPNVKISYEGVGSGAGVEQLLAGTVDFAATDVPLTDEQLAKFPVKPFHFPTLVGAVEPIYNLPGVTAKVKFSREALAAIFLGKIKTWNDARLKKDNPDLALPALPIKVMHRSGGSGTTYVLTAYLSEVSPEWKKTVGTGTTVKWPVGEEAADSKAVAEAVGKTPGMIAYVEANYAMKANLTMGAVQNLAGEFVSASFESLGAAVNAGTMTEDFRGSLVGATAKEAYPIASFTYLIVPGKYADMTKTKAMNYFLGWIYSQDGQKSVLDLDYGQFPPATLMKVQEQVDKVR